jgi:hypothetical protein
MPVVLLIREDAEVLERVTIETLASLLPGARIATLPRESNEQLADGPEWIKAIAEALESPPPIDPC